MLYEKLNLVSDQFKNRNKHSIEIDSIIMKYALHEGIESTLKSNDY